MPRLSRFNHFQAWRDGYYLAYNAVTGALALMTEENFATYQALAAKLSNGAAGNLDEKETELLGQLQYGRFVVDGEPPELDLLKFGYRKARYDQSSLGLIIAPTMACNMACPYCFEGNKQGRMSPRVIESVIGFVERQAEQLNDLSTTWYGGEPLLAMDIIEDLSASFSDLAEQYKFKYDCSGAISNGYLLDRTTADRLAALKMGMVQITIDGPARIHDQKRPLKNGRGSFHKIIENIQYASGVIPVVIRINLDKSFTPEIIEELLAELEQAELRNRVAIYFGQLEPATTVCANISDSCYEACSFSQTELVYYRLLLEHGFSIQRLPQPVMTFCFAQLMNSFLIDSNGDLYRCFNHAGDKSKVMGNVRQEIDYRQPAFNSLFSFDPFENESCRECGILPICMGGCPSRRADRHVPEEEVCDSWKYNLESMLELVALSRQQQARRQAEQARRETAS